MVAVQGGYAYLSDESHGLWILRCQPPQFTHEVGFCELPGSPYHLDIAGDYAYVACFDGHLQIVDISDPSDPFPAGYYETPEYPLGTGAVSVVVQGNYAYLVDRYYGLYILDVTDPTSPVGEGVLGMISYPRDVEVVGDHVYAVDFNGGFRIVNVSDPTTPTQVGFADLEGVAYAVTVSGDYAFVSRGWRGLTVFNVSNPGVISLVTNYSGLSNCKEIAIIGNYAYVADGSRMRILDITNPAGITELGYYSTGGAALGIAATHDRILVGDWEDGLYLFSNDLIVPSAVDEAAPARVLLRQNFPNPFNPSTTISLDLPKAADVVLSVYTVDGRRVTTRERERRGPGPHQVVWQGRDSGGRPVPSGTYYYRLEVDRLVTTKGMVLLK